MVILNMYLMSCVIFVYLLEEDSNQISIMLKHGKQKIPMHQISMVNVLGLHGDVFMRCMDIHRAFLVMAGNV